MRRNPVPFQNHTSFNSGWNRGGRLFRGFVLTVCFLAMAVMLALFLFRQTISSRLLQRIQQAIDIQLEGSGVSVAVGRVVWDEGSGLSLGSIAIRLINQEDDSPLISVDRVYIKSSFQLIDLISDRPKIDEVIVQGLMAQLAQDSSGKWNLEELVTRLETFFPLEKAQRLDCPIRVRGSLLKIQPVSVVAGESFRLDDINLDFVRQYEDDQSNIPLGDQIVGTFGSEVTGAIRFRCELDHRAGKWTFNADVNRLQIGGPVNGLLALLSPGNADLIAQSDGRIQLQSTATGALGEFGIPTFQVTGHVSEFQCLNARLPHAIHQGQFDFKLDNQNAALGNVDCHVGYGTAKGNLNWPNWLKNNNWQVDVDVAGLVLTERMVPWLPENLQRFWQQFDPQGVVNGRFQLARENGQLHRTIRSTIENGSYSWYKFPFRVSNCDGTINMDDRVMTLSGSAIEAQQLIQFDGRIVDPGVNWTGWLVGKCDGSIPINEKMLQAFNNKPELAGTLRKFNSTGHISGWGRVERQVARSEESRTRFEVQVHNATVRYDAFTYPFYNVNGAIVVDDDVTTIRELHGRNKNSEIACNGTWAAGNHLNLDFHAQNVTLDDELRQALPANLRRFWSSLRPTGSVDRLDVNLKWDPSDAQLAVDVEAELLPSTKGSIASVAIKPDWFPFELRQLSGKFRFNDQRIEINDLLAWHGRSTVSCAGTGGWNRDQWQVRLTDLVAGNIVLDQELLSALPVSLASGIQSIGFDGHLNLRGDIDVSGQNYEMEETVVNNGASASVNTVDRPESKRLGWNLDIGIGQAKMNVGLPLHNVNGVISSRGVWQNDQFNSVGELAIDSLMYRDIQVTQVRGPMSMDNNRVAIGAFSDPQSPDSVSPTVFARLFDGNARCDAQVMFDGDRDFYVQGIVSDADLKEMVSDVSVKQHDVSGKAFAGLRLAGNMTGAHSVTGNGVLQLDNARIFRLPVILALSNDLRVQEPDRTAFDQGQIDFSVHGEDIEIDRMELNGNTLSLIGNGSLNLDGEIDLDFYTVMGRNRFEIPLVSALFRAGSQQVWWIEVDGTLDEPVTTNNVLPGLNDSLRKLFPELETQVTSDK